MARDIPEPGDYELETGAGPFDELAARPPWRECIGFVWGWECRRHGGCNGGRRTCALEWMPRRVFGDEYGPTSPRTGMPCSWSRAWSEYYEGRAGGGLWDYETEAEMDRRNYRRRRSAAKERARAKPVRVRGHKTRAAAGG